MKTRRAARKNGAGMRMLPGKSVLNDCDEQFIIMKRREFNIGQEGNKERWKERSGQGRDLNLRKSAPSCEAE